MPPVSQDQIGGVVRLTIAGVIYPVSGEVTVVASGVKREGKAGSDGTVHGHTAQAIVPSIETTITLKRNVDPQVIFDTVDQPASVEWPNGKTFLLTGAYYAGDHDAKSEKGDMPIKLEGLTGTWN